MEEAMQWTDRIGRRVKLQDMHILLATVQWGSMAKAADRLAISQPVVSRSIASLEYALGVRLLDRSRKGIEPTMYARALLEHGLAAFNELRQGVKAIEFLSDPASGEVRVGCLSVIAAGLMPTVIDRFSRQYPRVLINVIEPPGVTQEFHDLRARDVDLVLGRVASPFTEDDLDAEVVCESQLVIVAGEQSPWTRRRKITLADLAKEPWLLPPRGALTRSVLADAFQADGLPMPEASVASTSIHLRLDLLATGRFVAPLPLSTTRFNAARFALKILPVKLPRRRWPHAIVTLKNRTLSPAVKGFIECVREVVKPLAKGKQHGSLNRT
jgi:DNA-binding transcriptional LysR family regulator